MRNISKFIEKHIWSPSSLLQFLRCPHMFWLQRIAQKKAKVPWYLPFGSATHGTVRAAHEGVGIHRGKFQSTPERPFFFKSPEKLLGHWRGFRWPETVRKARKRHGGIIWAYEDQYWALMHLGAKLLTGGVIKDWDKEWEIEGYWELAQNPPESWGRIEVLEVECPVKDIMLFGQYPFRARLDQIWRLPDLELLAVVDLTTSRSREVKHLQMAAYLEALKTHLEKNPEERRKFGNFPLTGIVWLLRYDERLQVKEWDPQRLREQLESAHRRLVEQDFAPTDQDDICRHCRYREICRGEPLEPLDFTEEPGEVIIQPTPTPRKPTPPEPKQLTLPHKKGQGWFRSDMVRGTES